MHDPYPQVVNDVRDELVILAKLMTIENPHKLEILVVAIVNSLDDGGLKTIPLSRDSLKKARRTVLDLFEGALGDGPSLAFAKKKILRLFGSNGLEKYLED